MFKLTFSVRDFLEKTPCDDLDIYIFYLNVKTYSCDIEQFSSFLMRAAMVSAWEGAKKARFTTSKCFNFIISNYTNTVKFGIP